MFAGRLTSSSAVQFWKVCWPLNASAAVFSPKSSCTSCVQPWNAMPPTEASSSSNITLCTGVPRKTLEPIAVKPERSYVPSSEELTVSSEVQFWNAVLGSESMTASIVTPSIEEQPENAPVPIEVREAGMTSAPAADEQPEKALAPMLSSPEGSETDCSAEQPEKVLEPIETRPAGNAISSSEAHPVNT